MGHALDVFRKGIEAYNRGDFEAMRPLLHEQVEAYVPPEIPNHGLFQGRDGFIQMVSQWDEPWEESSIEPLDWVERDDRLLADVVFRGRGSGSGVVVEQRFVHALTLRDGKLYRWRLHPDPDGPLAALEPF